ncbi:glycosyltransferase [Psychromonas aquimarina]|uniref:glycosyltransferase n=1 Tax=Psychromonas aquimarina TaxID=444919 RepID=UPI00041C5FFF|nr:glycosyltransferase [Psychromonas aquimarina]
MKVLHVYRTCYPETKGGLEQAIRFICKGCNKHNVESTILTLGDENKEYSFEGTKIIVVKKDLEISSNGFSIRLFKKFRELSLNTDIIHYQYPWPTADLLSLIAPNKPSIVSYQSDIVKQKFLKLLYWPLEQIFFSRVHKIIASSPQYANSSKNLTKYKNKVEVIPLAIDEKSYPIISDSLYKKWKKQVGEGFFLFIGVLRYYKGLKYLLEAANINRLPVVIAGDGPERESLKRYIDKHKLTNVKMVGFIEENDKVALHQLSKSFIFPSHLRSEAFGISLLEAQLYSRPIISCEIGTGSSYVNINNETGLVVEPANPKSLSDAMIKINSQPQLAIKLGKQAKIRYDNNFTITQYADNYLKLYKNLLNN